MKSFVGALGGSIIVQSILLASRFAALVAFSSPTSRLIVRPCQFCRSSSVFESIVATRMVLKDDESIPTEAEQANSQITASWTPQEKLLTTIGSTTSVVVAGTFYAVLAWKRDALMVSFFIGSILNGILSKLLKKVLNQSRPLDLNNSELDLPPSDNGMPSSHAMSLGFIGTFTVLQLPWTTVPLLVYVIVSLLYRVQSKLHTVEQIAVGIAVGSLNGFLWHNLCFGTNPLGINVLEWVSAHFLIDQGLLPWYGLVVPAVVGAAVVGSVERRISRFLSETKKAE